VGLRFGFRGSVFGVRGWGRDPQGCPRSAYPNAHVLALSLALQVICESRKATSEAVSNPPTPSRLNMLIRRARLLLGVKKVDS
jgi:hypothetical protein